jgi:hypothetical protein
MRACFYLLIRLCWAEQARVNGCERALRKVEHAAGLTKINTENVSTSFVADLLILPATLSPQLAPALPCKNTTFARGIFKKTLWKTPNHHAEKICMVNAIYRRQMRSSRS